MNAEQLKSAAAGELTGLFLNCGLSLGTVPVAQTSREIVDLIVRAVKAEVAEDVAREFMIAEDVRQTELDIAPRNQ